MDLTYSPQQKAFRQEVRDWLAAHAPKAPLASYDTREGFEQHRQWEATLFENRLSMVMWPTELGGRGCDLIEWLIFEEEYYGAGAPMRVNQNGQLLLGPTLMEFGTEAQKNAFCLAWRPVSTCGRKAGRSRTPVPTWPRLPAKPPATAKGMC